MDAPNRIPIPPADFVSYIGGGDFSTLGRQLFDLVRARCTIKPTDAVLDIGSGCGRIAVPFTEFMTTGTYDGIEVYRPMVEWCREEITSRFPQFRFHHADVFNTAYSPGSTGDAASYTFPLANESVDVVFAASVFTHLMPDVAARYAAETARVLKPGGRALFTFLLLNDQSRQSQKQFTFVAEQNGYAVTEQAAPERVLAFDESAALKLLRDAGLSVNTISHGAWSGAQGWTWQDAILLTRA